MFEYIITGGAGLIGSNCVQQLNEQGIENILVVDRLSTNDKWKNLKGLRFADYVERDSFLSQIQHGVYDDQNQLKALIHLGASTSTTEKDASHLVENNYECSKNLCKWALKKELRFVYASSASTYGDGSAGYSDKCDITTLRPLNMYGYSKHLFDLWALRTGILDKIVGLKYFNVYGPNEGHKGAMLSMVAKAFNQIQATGQVKLFKSTVPDCKDGGQRRDFMYVKDAVFQTLEFVASKHQGGIYNVGCGHARSFFDLVTAVFDALGKQVNVEFVDVPENLVNQYQSYTCAELRERSTSKLPMSLEEGVKDYVQNYLLSGKV